MEVDKSKVSVIITCFNQEAFIEEAVTSIINQTYEDWECIVVDDGSTDKSWEIIQKLAGTDQRIKCVLQENKGVSYARNRGFSMCVGDYIQFLDGDDYLAPEKLEIQVDFMEDNPATGVSYTHHRHYLQKKNISVQYHFKELSGKVLKEILYEYDNGVSIPIHSALLRKNVWAKDELPFPPDYDGRYEDWVFWVKIALKETNFRFLNYDMAFYRIHDNNFCNTREFVLRNSLKAMNYISVMNPKIPKESFIKQKEKFFENRYTQQSKEKINDKNVGFLFRELKHKAGTIWRNLEAKSGNRKEAKYRKRLVSQVIDKDFTIISNNCWGGGIYEDLNLQYRTPTVGLYFFSACYVKFVSDLQGYLSYPLGFITASKYDKANKIRERLPYPIGILNNEIEIHFLHYHTRREALEKWNKRKSRINAKNVFLSFTDNEGYTADQLEHFDKLPYPKVFFSAQELSYIKSSVQLKKFIGQPTVGDIYSNKWDYRNDFDVAAWLNKND